MAQTILLLVNPFAGAGMGTKAAHFLQTHLDSSSYQIEIETSQNPRYFSQQLLNKNLTKYDALVVIGGDGTLHEVLNGIAEKDFIPPLLLFPCGSGNAFNHDIENLDWNTALQKLRRRQTRKIDIFKINTPSGSTYAFNIIGWGLVADINQTAEKLRWLGAARYTVGALWHILQNPRFKGKLTVDGHVFGGDFCFVLACNTKHTGKAMKMAPLSDLTDGLLDVLIVPHTSFWHLLRLFPMIFSGKHIHSKLLIYKKAAQLSVEAAPQMLNIDGEIKLYAPFEVKVLPKQLEMIV